MITNACQGCTPAGSAFSRAHKYKFLGKVLQVLQTPLFATFPIGTKISMENYLMGRLICLLNRHHYIPCTGMREQMVPAFRGIRVEGPGREIASIAATFRRAMGNVLPDYWLIALP
jgi:hypothetical protein